jgi:hypothetical protein
MRLFVMKKIKLAPGKFAIVDDEDYLEIKKFKWSLGGNGHGKEYAVRHETIYMHRKILKTECSLIDHANGDGLDNRKDNLRVCTRSQNLQNRGAPKQNTSGFKGVRRMSEKWHPNLARRWQAFINFEGKQKSLGLYATKEEAALAYNDAAKKYFGEFAFLNKIRCIL